MVIKKIAFCTDFSENANQAFDMAFDLTQKYQAQLLLTHILREPELICRNPPTSEELDLVRRLTECNQLYATKYFDQLTSQLSLHEVNVQTRVEISKNPSETLDRLMDEDKVELVMLTAHGTSGSKKWPYGSLATHFILYGSTPVIILQDLQPEEIEKSKAELAAGEFKGH